MDVEGTTTPIAFVRDTLFPYARARMPTVLTSADPAVQAALADVPGADRLATLLAWMDADMKAGPLKTLQGLIWAAGYADGTLQGALYPDVAPALHRLHGRGVRLAVYSSGSVAAQRLLFRYSNAGDLAPLFDSYFDTAMGQKRDPASYGAIAAALSVMPQRVLFLSDVEAELDAAGEAGCMTGQVVRAGDGTIPGNRHPTMADFATL